MSRSGEPSRTLLLCRSARGTYRRNAALTAASCIGANTHGFHIEQAGYAAWSAVVWGKHYRTLQHAAYKTAVHCKVFAIPVRFVAASGLPGMAGITTHAEVTKASKRLDPAHAWWYTHLDPGPRAVHEGLGDVAYREIDEEAENQRLAYVALTRAQLRLYLPRYGDKAFDSTAAYAPGPSPAPPGSGATGSPDHTPAGGRNAHDRSRAVITRWLNCSIR